MPNPATKKQPKKKPPKKSVNLVALKKRLAVMNSKKPKATKKLGIKKHTSKKIDKYNTSSIIEIIKDEFEDVKDAIFFLEWLKCGQNCTKAYKNLHPECTEPSCRVLGSRQLAKVNKSLVLEAFGLGYEAYINQLKDGLNATKYIETSPNEREEVPDHKTRRAYHKVQGEILGIEKPLKIENINPIQLNFKSDKYFEEIE